jgi:hypothetical protein
MLMITVQCNKLSASNHYNENKNCQTWYKGHNNTEQRQKQLALALLSRNSVARAYIMLPDQLELGK